MRLDPTSGQLTDEILSLGDLGAPVDPAAGSAPWELSVFDDALYRVAAGTILRVDRSTAAVTEVVGPGGVPEPGDLQVFAGDTTLAVVSIDGDTAHLGPTRRAG